jgi:beta-lactamase superfamily II metal-dependent hydrolase
MTTTVHLLDVGVPEYGDALLLRFDDVAVLVDGAHPGDQVSKGGHEAFPDQLSRLLDQADPPYRVDLLVITHAHLDHIGCLPYLVSHELLAPTWALVADERLGWGRSLDDPRDAPEEDAPARHLVAALREEVPTRLDDDAVVSRLIADAADLETTYTAMLEALVAAGTNLVRFGRDDVAPLVSVFDGIGLDLIGPSQDHLLACAEIISTSTQDLLTDASETMAADVDVSVAELYRRWQLRGVDAATSRPGPAINLQSVVSAFHHDDVALLLAGDMQWADPQVSDPIVSESIHDLRAEIARRGPFDFVKLSHHGSDNALSPEVFGDFGSTPFFGICAGEQSGSHPNPEVLKILDEHSDSITWARTDHNRAATFTFGGDGSPIVEIQQGRLNDPVPNTADLARSEVAPIPRASVQGPPTRSRGGHAMQTVEITASVPYAPTRVTFSIDVRPDEATSTGPDTQVFTRSATAQEELRLGGGRKLPPLLFVTNTEALARNIGALEAQGVLAAIEASGQPLMRTAAESGSSASAVARSVVDELRRRGDRQGVVIVGGHDVVPHLIVDCLPPAVRARVRPRDADDFVVWSDDAYGDIDGDGLPEVPVARIPDGKSPELVRAALAADDARRPQSRCGVRNVLRPFADDVYAHLAQPRDLLVSAPATFDGAPPLWLDADAVYLMLHGDDDDSSRFWGEDPPGPLPVAVTVGNVPERAGRVVFTGACWGALTADRPANRAVPGQAIGQKTVGTSIALAFLKGGSTAFIGCTGSHYSPTEPPYDFHGGPMHMGFWDAMNGGAPPAGALLDAKLGYAQQMPHGLRTPEMQAVEYKILREFTCLGLGW